MPIPIISVPDLAPTQINAPRVNLAADNAPLQGLQQTAAGIAQVNQAFAQHADRVQSLENGYQESETRQQIAARMAEFNDSLAQNSDPSQYLPALDKVIAETQGLTTREDLSPVVREKLSFWHADMSAAARIQTAQRAAEMTTKRARLAFSNEIESAMMYGDRAAFTDAFNRMETAGLAMPEQKEAAFRQFDQQATYNSILKSIEEDPITVAEQLQSDKIHDLFPHLTPENKERLQSLAIRKANDHRAETWEAISIASMEGKTLSKEDVIAMAKEGDISSAEASSYLRTYHSPTPPEHDPFIFDQARDMILGYDRAKDPTGAIKATIARNLATAPLPKESIEELQSQFKARLNPSEADTPKHKLQADYDKRIKSDWQNEAFGNWFDNTRVEFTDPKTGEVQFDARTPISEKDFDQALSYKTKFTERFHAWLNNQPADIDPVEVGKKYKEIKAQVIDDILPLDFTPSLAPTFDDLDGLIKDPNAPAAAPTATEELPKTSYVPNAHLREATIPYERGGPAANVRYNNPAAAWPRPQDVKYGLIGYGKLNDGEGNKIGRFPTPVHGAAANFDLFASKYTGLTMQAAMNKWRGRPSPTPKGYDPNQVIDAQFLADPTRAIDFFKKMALHESPTFNTMTDQDWMKAHQLWKTVSQSTPKGDLPARKTAFFKTAKPRTAEDAINGLNMVYTEYYADQFDTLDA